MPAACLGGAAQGVGDEAEHLAAPLLVDGLAGSLPVPRSTSGWAAFTSDITATASASSDSYDSDGPVLSGSQ